MLLEVLALSATTGATMTNEPVPGGAASPGQTINIQAPYAQPTNGLAVASLVLGILALFTFWFPFLGWVPVVLGLVLGIVALQRPYGRGMAIVGVACSAIALIMKIGFWLLIIGLFARHHAAYSI